MTDLASHLKRAIVQAGVAVDDVSIGNAGDKATWTVQPSALQAAAQATIDAFDPADPTWTTQDETLAVTADLDDARLTSAVVWTILKQLYPADTDAQTKTKYGVARQRIIDTYRARPWV